MSEPTKNEIVKSLRNCLEYYGDLHAELWRIEIRRLEIRESLLYRKVLWSDPMTGGKDHSLTEMRCEVSRELDKAKIALHDAGTDMVHQCSPNARGFTLLKPGEVCDTCGFQQPEEPKP